jgi:hypothetical protein
MRVCVCVYDVNVSVVVFCRVLQCFLLFLYTKMVYDIGDIDLKDVTQQQLLQPVFTFDLIELFRLADFFRTMELLEVLCHNFFSPAVMFSPTCKDMLQQERAMASIIATLSHTETPELLHKLAETYIKGTGGLSCLCKWPTMFPRSTWDIMMKAGKGNSMFWAAHVLPLYVVRFDLGEQDAMRLLVDLNLAEWVQGTKSNVTVKDMTAKINRLFMCDRSVPGQICLHASTDVPDQRYLIECLCGVCLYVCMCVCAFVHGMYACRCIRACYVCVYVYSCTVCMRVCVFVHAMYACMCIRARYVCVYVYSCTLCMCVRVFVHDVCVRMCGTSSLC